MKLLRELTDSAGDFAATVGGVTLFLGRVLVRCRARCCGRR